MKATTLIGIIVAALVLKFGYDNAQGYNVAERQCVDGNMSELAYAMTGIFIYNNHGQMGLAAYQDKIKSCYPGLAK